MQVNVTIAPLYDQKHELIGASIIERDMTSLLTEQRKFEIAVEASPNAIVMMDENGNIVLINSQTKKLFGYNRQELMGQSIEMLIPENLEITKIWKERRSKKKVNNRQSWQGHEFSGIRKSGTKVSVEIGLSPITTPQGKFILASIVDITERKKFEQEIRKSEERYKVLVQTMNEGVLVVDNKDNIIFANEFMCKTLGYKLDELLGKRSSTLLLGKEQREQMKEIESLRKAGKSSKYEIEFTTKKKEKLWMLVSGSPLYDSDGKYAGSVGLHTNITNRKQIEQQLNAVANIPEENPNPTFRFSIDTQKVIYANPAAKSTLDFLTDGDTNQARKDWVDVINKVFTNNKSLSKEFTVNNNTYMCTIVPVTEKKYVNVYAVDITATKAAEAEIKRLSLILSKTENAVLIADKEGRIQWVNDGFVHITGYTLDEVKGTTGERLRRGRKTGLSKNHPYFKKMILTRLSVSYESHNFKKSGESYWTITTLTPIFDNTGELESVIAVDTDITYKKMAELEIIKAKKIAEDSAKSKELFLANMSHEIRTPMNAIMGMIQLLKDTKLNSEQLDYLKSMDFAGENLLRIINDVLDLAKIESGKMSIEAIQFNLDELLKDLFGSFSHRASEKGLDLIKQVQSTVPNELIGDPVRLNQILMNLIGNAIKFTEEGSVRLNISTAEKHADSVVLKFVVEDTGIGISPELHDIIFSDFEQANKEVTRKYGGTGLGLSIVKRLLSLQNGDIELVSSEGNGTRFIFTIPYKLGVAKASKGKLKSDRKQDDVLEDRKILLVEDNMLNQMVASRFLESMGADITVANNGLEAINKVAKGKYDLILMDIQMPEMDGYSATRMIRTQMNDEKKDVPILAMTAHAISGEKEKCMAAGMNDYLTKPLKRETLVSTVLNLLNTTHHD